jgi:rare lipoprotein A
VSTSRQADSTPRPDPRTGWRLAPLFFLLALAALLFPSCAYPGGYRGYQTRGYTTRGQYYQPMGVEEALNYQESGVASWYDESSFLGLKRGTTSLGEKVMPWHLIGAHKTLPLPCMVRVTNLENGRKVKIRINDRGPFIAGRLLDVSPRAARKLGFREKGLTRVHVEVLSVGDGSYERKRSRKWFFGLL